MLSMLYMSAEGAVDVASDGHPHGDDLTHQIDATPSLSPSTDTAPDTNLENDHCEHCCHGHLVSITSKLESALLADANDHLTIHVPRVLNYAQAPPTPPPNA